MGLWGLTADRFIVALVQQVDRCSGETRKPGIHRILVHSHPQISTRWVLVQHLTLGLSDVVLHILFIGSASAADLSGYKSRFFEKTSLGNMDAWKRLGFDGEVLGDGSRTILEKVERCLKVMPK